jgi:hypothetical protein
MYNDCAAQRFVSFLGVLGDEFNEISAVRLRLEQEIISSWRNTKVLFVAASSLITAGVLLTARGGLLLFFCLPQRIGRDGSKCVDMPARIKARFLMKVGSLHLSHLTAANLGPNLSLLSQLETSLYVQVGYAGRAVSAVED